MCCRAIKTKLIGVAGIAYQCPLAESNESYNLNRSKRYTRRLTLQSVRTRPTPRRPIRVASRRGGPLRSLPLQNERLRSRLPRQSSWPKLKIRKNKILACAKYQSTHFMPLEIHLIALSFEFHFY